ncbi:MAG: hypothetical protein Tsb0032_33960 [Kiloniellaceae bacterium]
MSPFSKLAARAPELSLPSRQLPSRRPPLGPGPRPRPAQTRSITVLREGPHEGQRERPNRPAEGRLIPWPEVPAYPVAGDLGLLTGPGSAPERAGGLLTLGQPFFTTAGRTALGWALRAAGLKAGDRVLLPAYHCLAMIEPMEWLGLTPVYYRLHEDLSIDLKALEGRLDPACKALVAVNYFGFPQDGARLRAFCDGFGLTLIEDCAHSFYGEAGGQPLGSFGDFTIGSFPKFFPLRAGGCLVSSRRKLDLAPLAAPGPLDNLQALVRELQMAHYYGRLGALRPATTAGAALAKLMLLARLGADPARLGDGARGLDYQAGAVARRTLGSSDAAWLAQRRRHNYETICRRLAGVPGVTLLKPDLAPGVVPYMVPLRLPGLRRVFADLEERALPMQRFGQFLDPALDESLCPVSSDLSHHGLQLPCHQSLRDDEIDWMVGQLAEACAAAGR